MMDVERLVAGIMGDALGVDAVLEVPASRPEEFVSVEQTGSAESGSGRVETHHLAVQTWAKTRRRAYELAEGVRRSAEMAENEEGVMSSRVTSCYRWPDPESRHERYQVALDVVTCYD